MNDSARNSIVAIYNTHTEAETAVHEVQSAGIDLKRLSIVGNPHALRCSCLQ